MPRILTDVRRDSGCSRVLLVALGIGLGMVGGLLIIAFHMLYTLKEIS